MSIKIHVGQSIKKYYNVSTSTINFGLILPIYTIYYIWNSLAPASIHQARIWRQPVFRLCQISSLSSVLKTVEIFNAFKTTFICRYLAGLWVIGRRWIADMGVIKVRHILLMKDT